MKLEHGFTTREEWEEFFNQYYASIRLINQKANELLHKMCIRDSSSSGVVCKMTILISASRKPTIRLVYVYVVFLASM